LRLGDEEPKVSADCSKDQAARRLYDETARAIAQISDGRHSGSGFFIEDGSRVVTNAHVVRLNNSLFEVRAHGGKAYEARIERYDNLNDLAILKLERSQRSPDVLELGSAVRLNKGEKLYAMGHRFRSRIVCTEQTLSH
jgi:Trypsin-like serine proteases, typically periplasmic, contain C-terminal PDZ domain